MSGEQSFKLLDQIADDLFSLGLLLTPAIPQLLPAVLALMNGDELLAEAVLAAFEVDLPIAEPVGERLALFAELDPLGLHLPHQGVQLLLLFVMGRL